MTEAMWWAAAAFLGSGVGGGVGMLLAGRRRPAAPTAVELEEPDLDVAWPEDGHTRIWDQLPRDVQVALNAIAKQEGRPRYPVKEHPVAVAARARIEARIAAKEAADASEARELALRRELLARLSTREIQTRTAVVDLRTVERVQELAGLEHPTDADVDEARRLVRERLRSTTAVRQVWPVEATEVIEVRDAAGRLEFFPGGRVGDLHYGWTDTRTSPWLRPAREPDARMRGQAPW